MGLNTYSSRNVAIALGGVNISGKAPDNFFSAQRNADRTEVEVGADSLSAISDLPDKSGTATLSLQQNSEANDILAGLVAADEAIGVLTKFALTVTDPSSGFVVRMVDCHIMTTPEFAFGSSASGSTRDWGIHCESMQFLPAGDVAGRDEDAISRITSAVDTIISNS